MKLFFTKIGIIFIFVLMFAFIADRVFDYFFIYFSDRKIVNNIDGDYDLIVLGNSRAKHNVIPNQLDTLLNISSANLGLPGSHPADLLYMLKYYLYFNKKPKIILVEIYEYFNELNANQISRQEFLQYYNSNIISSYFNYCEDNTFYNIPLYRYVKYRDLGWREFYKTIIKNRNKSFIKDKGYAPLYKKLSNDIIINKYNFDESILYNKHLDEIIKICRQNNIELIFFSSPVFSNHNYKLINILENYLPNYYNQTELLKEKMYFKDNMHINHRGAIIQTNDISIYINGKL